MVDKILEGLRSAVDYAKGNTDKYIAAIYHVKDGKVTLVEVKPSNNIAQDKKNE